jgi:hypothetical protein
VLFLAVKCCLASMSRVSKSLSHNSYLQPLKNPGVQVPQVVKNNEFAGPPSAYGLRLRAVRRSVKSPECGHRLTPAVSSRNLRSDLGMLPEALKPAVNVPHSQNKNLQARPPQQYTGFCRERHKKRQLTQQSNKLY